MATLGLKEMGKFLWEFTEKGLPCWPCLENAKKRSGIMKIGLDAMPLFLLDNLLTSFFVQPLFLASNLNL